VHFFPLGVVLPKTSIMVSPESRSQPGEGHAARAEAAREVAYFCRWVFRERPADLGRITDLYLRFHETYSAELGGAAYVKVKELVARNCDVVAVEFYLRRARPGNLLSRKIQALFYIAEATPELRDLFYPAPRTGLLAALSRLGVAVARSVYRYLKGCAIVRWHHAI
jgi:hypothetical protein